MQTIKNILLGVATAKTDQNVAKKKRKGKENVNWTFEKLSQGYPSPRTVN